MFFSIKILYEMFYLVIYDFYGLYLLVLNVEYVCFIDISNNLKINGIKCVKGNCMSSS